MLEVAGEVRTRLEREGLHRLNLSLDEQMDQIEVRRDAPGASVILVVGDFTIWLARPFAVHAPHLFDEDVIDDLDNGINPIPGHFQRGVDGEPGAHDGDVEVVNRRHEAFSADQVVCMS